MGLGDFLRGKPAPEPRRVLTASATRIQLDDRSEVERIKKTRGSQKWQADAWAYYDSIAEIRYAVDFLGHALGRLRLYAAVPVETDEVPVPLAEADGRFPAVAPIADLALSRMYGERSTASHIMSPLAVNFEIAGEATLAGYTDESGVEQWGVYSGDQVLINQGELRLRDFPGQTFETARRLDPASSFAARLWSPHPHWSGLANAPMRPLLDVCEELLIASRAIRATGRSRLAGAGILLVPDSLMFGGTSTDVDPTDPEGDQFMNDLTRAMTAPLSDEGSAASVVPMTIRGASSALEQVRHLALERPLDASLPDRVDKALRRIALGLDTPPEVLFGIGDVNHWGSWQVEESTFKYHIEPLALQILDALTVAYLRPALIAAGVDPELVSRVVIWYDHSALTVRPNRTQDAKDLHSALVLSDEALRQTAGFNAGDAPSEEEILRRVAMNRGTVDSAMVETIVARLMTELNVQRWGPAGTVRLDPENPPVPTAAIEGLPVEEDPAPAVRDSAPAPTENAPPQDTQASALAGQITAAAARARAGTERLARRQVDADRELRNRVQAAADAALRRALEKAGARLRTRTRTVARANAAVAAAADAADNRRLWWALTDAGLTAAVDVGTGELLDGAFDDLHEQWDTWIAAAAVAAAVLAAKLVGVDVDAPAVTALRSALTVNTATGWARLEASLTDTANRLLTDPDADLWDETGELTAGVHVRPGEVRAALAEAAGLPASHAGLTDTGRAALDSDGVPGFFTGGPVQDFLTEAGTAVVGYVWVWGHSARPYPPHEDLDGTEFTGWDDPAVGDYTPGDHSGCTCDYQLVYGDASPTGGAADTAEVEG